MVETKLGRIEGLDCGSYVEYRGVPYAMPPVGDLRWKAPVPLDPWEGVFRALEYGNMSMEPARFDELYTPEFRSNPEFFRTKSEDCLYLNIWVPKGMEGKKLPVAFWIHGGAFLHGSAVEVEFDGEAYCRRGVILVSVEYRMNLFGFFAHRWLSRENPEGISGNYGILDQIMALTWVYDNISAFGGDPENITVFGQSAGAMSTQTLISSNLTGNMIAKAIMQSGGSYGSGLNRDMPLSEEEAYGEKLPEILGVSSLEEMRAKSADEILAALEPFMNANFPAAKGLFLLPIIDGKVLEDGYNALIDQFAVKNIPYMLGSTKDDILTTPDMVAKGEKSDLYKGITAFAKKMNEPGRKPVYTYYFEHDLPGDSRGAWHSSELWYMFGTLKRCWRPFGEADYKLSEEMLDYWTNFMKTGDPNGEGLKEWRPCTKADPFEMSFK